MKFKPIHLIEQKVLNYIKAMIYREGIRHLQDYISLPKFIPQDGHIHGSVNVHDIKLRLDAIQHNVWSIGPVEFFMNEMTHNWFIAASNQLDENGCYPDGMFLMGGPEHIGPFKSRYDAAVYGVNMLMKEE